MPVRWAIVYLAAAFWPVPVASAAQQPALWRVAGQAGFPGFSGDGGRAVDARLDTPTGIAFDTAGNLYVADTANSRVRRITPRGRISTIGRVRYPQAIAVDPQGNVFVADGDRSRILKRSPDGALTRFAGTGKSGFSGDGGPATAAALDSPSGLAVGGEGSVYIADTGNDRVRKVAPDGTITTVATGLGRPLGLSVDAAGALVVAAAGDNVVRKVAPDGAVTTVAGTGADGLGGRRRTSDGGKTGGATRRGGG